MAEYTMTPSPALGGLNIQVNETRLTEVQDARLTVLSIPLGEAEAFAGTLRERLGSDMPAVGRSAATTTAGTQVLRVHADRVMVLSEGDQPDLSGIGYAVDHSDYWAMLDLTGPATLAALARTCRLKLAADAFPVGAVARTSTEGMATMVWRTAADSFRLMTPRSFARSFAHAIETSLAYCQG